MFDIDKPYVTDKHNLPIIRYFTVDFEQLYNFVLIAIDIDRSKSFYLNSSMCLF